MLKTLVVKERSLLGAMVNTLAVFCALLCLVHAKKLNTSELLGEYGLASETHQVVTKDGYILTIFRVPGKFPVLVMPGFLSSSNTWVVSPKNQSMVAALAGQGYDVWLLNYRGSYYGKKHVNLDPVKDAARFWDFTFQEIGSQDLPAMVDYVLARTRRKDLLYVGHSMGCLSLYIMCMEKPDYCAKVRAAGLLAPVIFPPSYVDQALLSTGIKLVKNFAWTARLLGVNEVLGDEESRAESVRRTCSLPAVGSALCSLGVTLPFSGSTENVHQESLPKYVINTLSGTSLKLAEHMTQLMTSNGGVPKYNYGRSKNKQKYRRAYAPYYNGTVKVPLIVFHSTSDPFTDQQAVDDLKQVSTVVYDKLITDKTFNHVNFIFSNHVMEYVVKDLIFLFNKVSGL